MKKRKDKTSSYLDRAFEVPDGTFSKGANIEINSDRQVYIEGSKGVLEYDDNYIVINIGTSTVKLIGRDLFIKQINTDNLMVCGRLMGLEFDS
ncbi:MAG: YabP/YqfC family sporulation protein [Acutalibacteraceae bacterium]|nr:YabP/YqfC family sporulation protein [Acutalibacteraceae bacterium]